MCIVNGKGEAQGRKWSMYCPKGYNVYGKFFIISNGVGSDKHAGNGLVYGCCKPGYILINVNERMGCCTPGSYFHCSSLSCSCKNGKGHPVKQPTNVKRI